MNAPIPQSAMPKLAGEIHFPIVIIGAGPTGLMLANLLGTYGIKTLVIERNTTTVGEPRAVSIDDESLRTAQAAGLIDAVLPQIVQGYGVHYYSWRGKPFARIEPQSMENGFPKRNAFRQQLFVGTLRDGLARFDHTAIWFGHELERFQDNGETVQLQLKHDGETKHIRCDFLVACDGGRSNVREQLGIPLIGSSYDEKWLIVDLLDRTSAFRHTRTYCDPARPTIRLPGPGGTLRYEFMLHPGENPETVLGEIQIRQWIHHREPSDAQLTITRKVVYAFHARVAERWQVGRVFLAGDAAHLTPPFAGQGMNSGVRDTANLAWKLAAVVRGELPQSLLSTYTDERKPHAWALIEMAVRIGNFMQPKSVLAAMLAQGALKLCSLYPPVRDYVLQLKFKPKPRFQHGFFARAEKATVPVVAGQLFPQPMVELSDGRQSLLDELLGNGFVWLGLADAESLPSFPLPYRRIRVVAQQDDFLPTHASDTAVEMAMRDVTGVLETILRDAGANAVLLRPDRYVLAYLGRDGQLDDMRLRQLMAQFAPQTTTTTA